MSKLQDIRDLAQEHAVSVSGSPRDWMDYICLLYTSPSPRD